MIQTNFLLAKCSSLMGLEYSLIFICQELLLICAVFGQLKLRIFATAAFPLDIFQYQLCLIQQLLIIRQGAPLRFSRFLNVLHRFFNFKNVPTQNPYFVLGSH